MKKNKKSRKFSKNIGNIISDNDLRVVDSYAIYVRDLIREVEPEYELPDGILINNQTNQTNQIAPYQDKYTDTFIDKSGLTKKEKDLLAQEMIAAYQKDLAERTYIPVDKMPENYNYGDRLIEIDENTLTPEDYFRLSFRNEDERSAKARLRCRFWSEIDELFRQGYREADPNDKAEYADTQLHLKNLPNIAEDLKKAWRPTGKFQDPDDLDGVFSDPELDELDMEDKRRQLMELDEIILGQIQKIMNAKSNGNSKNETNTDQDNAENTEETEYLNPELLLSGDGNYDLTLCKLLDDKVNTDNEINTNNQERNR